MGRPFERKGILSEAILIIAPSGSGKTFSLQNADPRSSYMIQVIRKSLPFRGWKKKWIEATPSKKDGNLFVSDDPEIIIRCLEAISNTRSNIKNVFIDDSQYIMANDFMRTALEKGYDKFSRIGKAFWGIVVESKNQRPDLNIFFLHHSEVTDAGETKAKTVGKMLDDKITLEGMFTIVIRAGIEDGRHVFYTKNSGHDTVKTPHGMFKDSVIDNDITIVIKAISTY